MSDSARKRLRKRNRRLLTALTLAALAGALLAACGSGAQKRKVQPPTQVDAGQGGAPESGGTGGSGGSKAGALGESGGRVEPGGAGQAGSAGTDEGRGGTLNDGGAAGAGAEAGTSGEAGGSGEAGSGALTQCGDGALSFSDGQFVQIPGTATLHLQTAMTLEAWIKTTSAVATESLFLAKHSCGTDNGYLLEIYTNSSNGAHVPNAPAFYVGANTQHVYGQASVVDGKWHHIAGTWDGATSTLYVDGAFVASRAITVTHTNNVDLFLGAATTGACLNYTGLMDEVSVWSVARTPEQIAADASAPIAKNAPGLEAYFDFNGAACGQTLLDRSPNARNGLLGGSADVTVNDPVWVSDGPF